MPQTQPNFEPPGPGPWELELAHFGRPISPFAADAVTRGMAPGFSESTARYGLLLSHFDMQLRGGFLYQQPVAFGAPKGAMGPPPRLVLWLLTRLLPSMRKRIETSHQAFQTKSWRADLERWDREVKPAAIRAHQALQAIDHSKLDDAGLIEHVRACHAHYIAMVTQHHQFTITSSLPIGDFMAHVIDWTGKKPGEILQALRGSSEISKGAATEELVALANAIRGNAELKALVEGSSDASAVVEKLTHAADPVGPAMHAYLELIGYRSCGYDCADPFTREMPEILLRGVRAQVANEKPADRGPAPDDRIAALRAAVPEAHRGTFDELLAEARNINRLRDERGHYSDSWAAGLMRRALLEAGARLVRAGKLSAPQLAVDANLEEIVALLSQKPGPSTEELEKRALYRRTAKSADMPPFLRAMPAPPPPTEWLPEKARRASRAIDLFITSLFVAPPAETTKTSVKGLPVSPGVYEGTARLIDREDQFSRLQQGDVLITRTTSPYFNIVLPLLGAIVTDRGGQLCHAAIVSREYGIPSVVGTRDATRLIQDGQRVRVNGDTGLVEVLT